MPAIDFEALFNATPTPLMALDRELRFVAANEAYLQVTASTREELLGRVLFDLFPDEPTDPNRHSASLLRRSLERVLESGQPDTVALIPYKVPLRTQGGVDIQDRYWSATHTPVFDDAGQVAYVLQNTVDVTQLQELHAAAKQGGSAMPPQIPVEQLEAGVLQRAELLQEANRSLDLERRHLRRLFDQAPGFICFLRGKDHIFELANAAYYQLVGNRGIIGRPVAEALPEVARQGFAELLDRVFASGEPYLGRHVPVLLERRPGQGLEERFADFIYQPILGPDGTVSGIFVQGSDVTEQVHAQRELERYREHLEELVDERTRALEESQASLRQAQKMESLGQLTGGVAHDFNNILAATITSLELALRREPESASARLIENALRASRRGASLVDQLLAFARKQQLESRPCELSGLIHSFAELLKRAVGSAVELHLELAEGLWLVRTDPAQFENALLNLVMNARDAMGAGGGQIRISTRNVPAGSTDLQPDLEPGDYVRMTVTDTGSGMDAAVVAKAFEPFYTTKGKGTGLGLSQVYGFAKQSGGTAVIASRPGAGTRVHLYLPRTHDRPLLATENAAAKPLPALDGVRLLVVDDDDAVRAALEALLRELGARVVTAENAARGLQQLADDAAFDGLLADYAMPGMSGVELIQQVRQDYPALPCLLVTGYVGDEAARAATQTVPTLRKPFSVAELGAALERLLDHGAGPGSG